MTTIETIKAEIKRRMKRFESHIEEYEDTPFTRIVDVNKIRLDECTQILHNIDTLQEQSVSEGLEEEINEQWGSYTHDGFSAGIDRDEFNAIARHFAQWQKEQMLKEAVDGRVFMSFAPGHNQMVMADVDLPTNTKVKVIVIKED